MSGLISITSRRLPRNVLSLGMKAARSQEVSVRSLVEVCVSCVGMEEYYCCPPKRGSKEGSVTWSTHIWCPNNKSQWQRCRLKKVVLCQKHLGLCNSKKMFRKFTKLWRNKPLIPECCPLAYALLWIIHVMWNFVSYVCVWLKRHCKRLEFRQRYIESEWMIWKCCAINWFFFLFIRIFSSDKLIKICMRYIAG